MSVNHRVSISMNLEIRQQQCCIICKQFKFRANKMTQDVNSAVLPDQSVLSFRSSAKLLHGRSAADVSPAYAALSSLVLYASRPFEHSSSPRLSLHSLLTNTLPDPSASEVTTLWRYTNL